LNENSTLSPALLLLRDYSSDRGDQVILADDAIAIFDEIDEKIENLWLESDRGVTFAQLTALAVQLIIIE
jgi:hypothetical protein